MIDIDKLKEALKEIWNGMANRQGFVKEFKLIETTLTELQRLQAKEIPFKPLKSTDPYIFGVCECGKNFECNVDYNSNYCPVCGKRLDWSDKT